MYKKFFGFAELPFQLVPNPAYLYLSKSHEEALAHLTYAISQGDGFVSITGEVGTGKTTLCRVFLDSLSENSEAAYIFNPKLDSIQLLKAINDDFNLDSSKDNIKDLIDVLNDFLLTKKKEKKTILLIIDEAQNLAPEVLEQLRLLSNLETSTSKLIQIILVGQPELTDKFDSFELRQLGQRITLSCRILPLTFEETCEYIRHRIHIASGRPGVRFEQTALKAVYNYSKGVPRLINILCDRALLTAFVLEDRKIAGSTVKLAISELKGDVKTGRKKRVSVPALLFSFLLVVMAAIYGWYSLEPSHKRKLPVEEPAVKVFPVPDKKVSIEPVQSPEAGEGVTPATDKHLALIEVLTDTFSEHSRRIALKAALSLWTETASVKEQSDFIEDDLTYFKLGTKQNGMVVYRADEEFSFLLRLNMPAILEFYIPGYSNSIFLVCTRVDEETVILTADDGKTVSMPKDQIDIYWSGIAYIPWKNFLGCMGTIPHNAGAEAIITLKMLLSDIGFSTIEMNNTYDETAQRAVMEIQERHGITVDGTVGALTKMALYNEAYSKKIPHILSGGKSAFQEPGALVEPVDENISEPVDISLVSTDLYIGRTAAKITKVAKHVTDECVEINIAGENIDDNYTIFSIPAKDKGLARIVCDIPCLKGVKTWGEKTVPVGVKGVDKIRYFTYRGKMRVVVDVAKEKINMLSYKSTGSEIIISVAEGLEEQKLKIAAGETEVKQEGEDFSFEDEKTEPEQGRLM